MDLKRITKLQAFAKTPFVLSSILFSGFCWYFSMGLSGDLWWLAWIAPVPILLLSVAVPAKKAFLCAFIAYLLGRMSWVSYLHTVVPLTLVILFSVLLPLIFALIILAVRKIFLESQHWISAFAFPVLFTGYEWLFFILSRDGTAASLAYSQFNCLPLIQIASITGLLGIVFFICFFPAALAALIIFWKQKNARVSLLFLMACILMLVFVYGLKRTSLPPQEANLKIAMAVIEERRNQVSAKMDSLEDPLHWYSLKAGELAGSGAKIILLPEKIAVIKNPTGLREFQETAKNFHVFIIAGYTLDSNGEKLNRAVLVGPDGIMNHYSKVNLYEGESYEGFVAGHFLGKIMLFEKPMGMVVCKDMDFQRYIRRYKDATILFVPAWDFVSDGWLHSRMAIMRGVENGFSIVRNAREGRLTVSDYRGKILSETSSADGQDHLLTAYTPEIRVSTFYSRTGDWFGVINFIAGMAFLVFLFINRQKK